MLFARESERPGLRFWPRWGPGWRLELYRWGRGWGPARRPRPRSRRGSLATGPGITRLSVLFALEWTYRSLSSCQLNRRGGGKQEGRLLWRRWSEFAEVKDLRVCQLTGRGVICGEKMGSSTLSSAAEDHGGLHGGLLKLLLERRRAHLHTNVMNNGTLPGADWHRDGNQTDTRGPYPVRQKLWSHTRGMNVMASWKHWERGTPWSSSLLPRRKLTQRKTVKRRREGWPCCDRQASHPSTLKAKFTPALPNCGSK
nr:uncharacterized protein LOC106783330 isoform X6 [Equus caballus]